MMPSVHEDTSDVERSLTYASYERETETSFLLSGNKSRKFLLSSTLSEESIDGGIKNEGKKYASRSRGVVLMIVCLYMNMASSGIGSALGVIYVELISAFQCQRSEAALVQSLYLGVSLGGAIFFTKIITKYDTGACVMASSIVAGIALACASLARDIGTVIALVGVVVSFFASVGVLSTQIVINWTFVSNSKIALGILTLGNTFGQAAMPYIANILIEEYSWKGCFIILSAIAYFNFIPCGLIFHYSKEYFQKGDKTITKSYNTSISNFLTDGAFIVYLVALLIFTTLGPVEAWFVVDVAVLKDFGTQSGATLLSLNGIFGFVGRITSTAILKVYPNTRPELHMCYGFILLGIAHLGVIASPVFWGMFLAMVLRGLVSGIVIAFMPTMQLELKGSESFPQTVAISNLILGIGCIIGGYVGGYSVDVTGSYSLIFYIASVGSVYCGISMLIIFVIFKRRKSRFQKLTTS